MFTIIGLMLTGMLLGYLLRRRDLKKIHQIITLLIWLLLFILGIEVGSNEQIIKGLHTIGLEAVILTLGGTLGSVIAAWALWRVLYKRKETEHERKSYHSGLFRTGYDLRCVPSAAF